MHDSWVRPAVLHSRCVGRGVAPVGTAAAACSGRPQGEGAGYPAAMSAESEPEGKGTVSARL